MITPWSDITARTYAAMARQCLLRHDHDPHDHCALVLDNCGACVLAGRRTGDDHHPDVEGPNYAGWARVYVEATRQIPPQWARAFARELASDNQAYADALRRSIATFGVRGVPYRVHGCACEDGKRCSVRHATETCSCLRCVRATLLAVAS